MYLPNNKTGNPEGEMSEWNEGVLKSIRLNSIQILLNNSKVDLTARSLDFTHFNYELWITSIDLLYGEGKAKYSEPEIEEVDKIKELAFKTLKLFPPCTYVIEHKSSGKNKTIIVNKENLDRLIKLGDIFETAVKKYNDKHGLSTKNKGTGGLF